MLVAYGPGDQPVVADETPLEQLRQLSQERLLICPNCRGIVHVRGGPEKRIQLHFAHQRGECAWSTEAESVRHMRGKIVLATWLRAQFPQASVTLEERLPGSNRIADIFMQHPDGHRQALEFQCAPLDLDEWQRRHQAYRAAGICDTWIIGENRREKQEAFLEAILGTAREILFLDPLADEPRTWLRWPATRAMIQAWQREATLRPSFEGWVGRLGSGVTLVGALMTVQIDRQGLLLHPRRTALLARLSLLERMTGEPAIDEAALVEYLEPAIGAQAIQRVILPLLRAYTRDPDLLRRYNYGRGQHGQPPGEADLLRVQRARAWLEALAQQDYDAERLRALARDIPFVGPYAALAGYLEMLVEL
ncbi:MAG TPA: competence protein CoiA family protein [Ktedonobacteraceae bacterium]|nr:competence protein CoiA family protein [Ktedonobacteraceae bacterium]